MLAAIVLFTVIASLHSGLGAVTQEWARCQHAVTGVVVSPSLSHVVADLCLLRAPTGHRVYRPRPHRSSSDAVITLLLLHSGVELNPGPTASACSIPRDALALGVLNVCSASHKATILPVSYTHLTLPTKRIV